MTHRAETVQDPQRPLLLIKSTFYEKFLFKSFSHLMTTLGLGGGPASEPLAAHSSSSPPFAAGFRTLKWKMLESVLFYKSLYRGEIFCDSRKIILQSHRLSIEQTTFIVRKSSGVSSGYKGC